MSIYKHVAPGNTSNSAIEEVSKEQVNPCEIEASDDSFEYFSDKEEAENYKRKTENKTSPKT